MGILKTGLVSFMIIDIYNKIKYTYWEMKLESMIDRYQRISKMQDKVWSKKEEA